MSAAMPSARVPLTDDGFFRLRRGLLAVSAVLAIIGVSASVYLTDLHIRVHSDPSFQPACDVNQVFRCSDVALSPYSHLWGAPMSVWSLLGYAGFLFFQIWGLAPDRQRRWPAGLYWLLSAFTLLSTFGLFYIAEFIIHAWCLGCITLYVSNVLLFVIATWLLWRDPGALGRDLRALPRNRPALALAVLFLLTSIGVSQAYPKYWLRPPQSECNGLATGVGGDGSCWIGAREPVLEITEYSDYLCPFCQRAHGQLRDLVSKHPERVRLVHRHFPLDTDCNPALRTQMHAGACLMARMAYCAGLQGQFWKMNDLLFAQPHGSTPDARALAGEAGLDADRFAACIDAPAALAHVQADVQEGLRLKISGTPTFVIDGQMYVGQIPPEVLAAHLGETP
jgi:uncharacterized membrane protein